MRVAHVLRLIIFVRDSTWYQPHTRKLTTCQAVGDLLSSYMYMEISTHSESLTRSLTHNNSFRACISFLLLVSCCIQTDVIYVPGLGLSPSSDSLVGNLGTEETIFLRAASCST